MSADKVPSTDSRDSWPGAALQTMRETTNTKAFNHHLFKSIKRYG